jgi:hypothetical protein
MSLKAESSAGTFFGHKKSLLPRRDCWFTEGRGGLTHNAPVTESGQSSSGVFETALHIGAFPVPLVWQEE